MKIINLLHVSAPWCHIQWLFQFKEIQYSPGVFILCDTEDQATANRYKNSATYVCVKSNSSCHKVSISYSTQTVGTVRSVIFSQTVTHALSSVTQCNLIVLWVVSSGASAQTLQRPTAVLPSGFWHRWIQSLTKLYTATGTWIAVGLGVESYFETSNGAGFFFCKICVHLNQLTMLIVWEYSIVL